jgi:hypothetical protein
MTKDQIIEFQRGRFDWEGKPLLVDGALGPRTRWALAISRLDPRRQAIVARACSKVGQRETVANRGEWPDFVLRRCGIYVPDDPSVPMPDNAWCAAHASWCMSVDGLPERKEPGARDLATSLRPTTIVLPGDFGWYPTGGWRAHIFPIIGVAPGEVACADGNWRNGCALVRRRTSEIRIVTALPVEELADIPPGLPLVTVQREDTR